MDHMDEVTLLALASTCKHLNDIVAPFYTKRENIKITKGTVILGDNISAVHALRAIQIFFKAATITKLLFLAKPGFERFERELFDICQLVKHTKSLQTFTLTLGGLAGSLRGFGIDGWIDKEGDELVLPPGFGPARLVRLFADLVDAL